MCNLYRLDKAPAELVALARAMGLRIGFPEGVPNVEPRDIRLTEMAPILRPARADADHDAALVARRWSWPLPNGKPVFNFRSDGRRFAPAGRCVVLADAFYEFTAPREAGKKTKDRWRFTLAGEAWFGIAGIVRADPAVGEAFTMLTCDPGPDVAPYHARQVVLLRPARLGDWLSGAVPADELLRPLPAGSLAVEPA